MLGLWPLSELGFADCPGRLCNTSSASPGGVSKLETYSDSVGHPVGTITTVCHPCMHITLWCSWYKFQNLWTNRMPRRLMQIKVGISTSKGLWSFSSIQMRFVMVAHLYSGSNSSTRWAWQFHDSSLCYWTAFARLNNKQRKIHVASTQAHLLKKTVKLGPQKVGKQMCLYAGQCTWTKCLVARRYLPSNGWHGVPI